LRMDEPGIFSLRDDNRISPRCLLGRNHLPLALGMRAPSPWKVAAIDSWITNVRLDILTMRGISLSQEASNRRGRAHNARLPRHLKVARNDGCAVYRWDIGYAVPNNFMWRGRLPGDFMGRIPMPPSPIGDGRVPRSGRNHVRLFLPLPLGEGWGDGTCGGNGLSPVPGNFILEEVYRR